jgi:arginase family enzyme
MAAASERRKAPVRFVKHSPTSRGTNHAPSTTWAMFVATTATWKGASTACESGVRVSIRSGHRPLVLGGGHETAWGTFQGIVAAKPDPMKVGVINIDAHLDLRADEPANSGTPFYQIAKWCQENDRPPFRTCVWVSEPSNTAALFERARISCGTIWQCSTRPRPVANSDEATSCGLDKFDRRGRGSVSPEHRS